MAVTSLVPALCVLLSLLLVSVTTGTYGYSVAGEKDHGKGQVLRSFMDPISDRTYQRRAARSTQEDKQGYTFKERRGIVRKHNELRNSVQPPASNMLEMSWSTELETIAQNHANKCVFKHNADRTDQSSSFYYVGENVYAHTNTYNGQAVVQSWFNETKYYDYETNTCDDGEVCGHYTQVVWADSYAVGCGVKSCAPLDMNGMAEDWDFGYLVVCNYGPGGNFRGQKPYEEDDGSTE